MSWREQMQVSQSNMEFDVQADLNKLGFFPVTQEPFVVFECKCGRTVQTIPDQTFHDKKLCVYIDYEKHHNKLHREQRDTWLRTLVKLKWGYTVLVCTYTRHTKTQRRRIVAEILEALK